MTVSGALDPLGSAQLAGGVGRFGGLLSLGISWRRPRLGLTFLSPSRDGPDHDSSGGVETVEAVSSSDTDHVSRSVPATAVPRMDVGSGRSVPAQPASRTGVGARRSESVQPVSPLLASEDTARSGRAGVLDQGGARASDGTSVESPPSPTHQRAPSGRQGVVGSLDAVTRPRNANAASSDRWPATAGTSPIQPASVDHASRSRVSDSGSVAFERRSQHRPAAPDQPILSVPETSAVSEPAATSKYSPRTRTFGRQSVSSRHFESDRPPLSGSGHEGRETAPSIDARRGGSVFGAEDRQLPGAQRRLATDDDRSSREQLRYSSLGQHRHLSTGQYRQPWQPVGPRTSHIYRPFSARSRPSASPVTPSVEGDDPRLVSVERRVSPISLPTSSLPAAQSEPGAVQPTSLPVGRQWNSRRSPESVVRSPIRSRLGRGTTAAKGAGDGFDSGTESLHRFRADADQSPRPTTVDRGGSAAQERYRELPGAARPPPHTTDLSHPFARPTTTGATPRRAGSLPSETHGRVGPGTNARASAPPTRGGTRADLSAVGGSMASDRAGRRQPDDSGLSVPRWDGAARLGVVSRRQQRSQQPVSRVPVSGRPSAHSIDVSDSGSRADVTHALEAVGQRPIGAIPAFGAVRDAPPRFEERPVSRQRSGVETTRAAVDRPMPAVSGTSSGPGSPRVRSTRSEVSAGASRGLLREQSGSVWSSRPVHTAPARADVYRGTSTSRRESRPFDTVGPPTSDRSEQRSSESDAGHPFTDHSVETIAQDPRARRLVRQTAYSGMKAPLSPNTVHAGPEISKSGRAGVGSFSPARPVVARRLGSNAISRRSVLGASTPDRYSRGAAGRRRPTLQPLARPASDDVSARTQSLSAPASFEFDHTGIVPVAHATSPTGIGLSAADGPTAGDQISTPLARSPLTSSSRSASRSRVVSSRSPDQGAADVSPSVPQTASDRPSPQSPRFSGVTTERAVQTRASATRTVVDWSSDPADRVGKSPAPGSPNLSVSHRPVSPGASPLVPERSDRVSHRSFCRSSGAPAVDSLTGDPAAGSGSLLAGSVSPSAPFDARAAGEAPSTTGRSRVVRGRPLTGPSGVSNATSPETVGPSQSWGGADGSARPDPAVGSVAITARSQASGRVRTTGGRTRSISRTALDQRTAGADSTPVVPSHRVSGPESSGRLATPPDPRSPARGGVRSPVRAHDRRRTLVDVTDTVAQSRSSAVPNRSMERRLPRRVESGTQRTSASARSTTRRRWRLPSPSTRGESVMGRRSVPQLGHGMAASRSGATIEPSLAPRNSTSLTHRRRTDTTGSATECSGPAGSFRPSWTDVDGAASLERSHRRRSLFGPAGAVVPRTQRSTRPLSVSHSSGTGDSRQATGTAASWWAQSETKPSMGAERRPISTTAAQVVSEDGRPSTPRLDRVRSPAVDSENPSWGPAGDSGTAAVHAGDSRSAWDSRADARRVGSATTDAGPGVGRRSQTAVFTRRPGEGAVERTTRRSPFESVGTPTRHPTSAQTSARDVATRPISGGSARRQSVESSDETMAVDEPRPVAAGSRAADRRRSTPSLPSDFGTVASSLSVARLSKTVSSGPTTRKGSTTDPTDSVESRTASDLLSNDSRPTLSVASARTLGRSDGIPNGRPGTQGSDSDQAISPLSSASVGVGEMPGRPLAATESTTQPVQSTFTARRARDVRAMAAADRRTDAVSNTINRKTNNSSLRVEKRETMDANVATPSLTYHRDVTTGVEPADSAAGSVGQAGSQRSSSRHRSGGTGAAGSRTGRSSASSRAGRNGGRHAGGADQDPGSAGPASSDGRRDSSRPSPTPFDESRALESTKPIDPAESSSVDRRTDDRHGRQEHRRDHDVGGAVSLPNEPGALSMDADVDRVVDVLYRRLERKFRIERQRKGL